MLTAQENERLTRVGPRTPMGEAFRRYWIPAALSEELPERDGPPVRVRLLGEDLIAYRDTEGVVGLVDAYCPHRRAPMFFGRNEECGLRCVYHGWKFDRSGACIDMPSELPDSLFKSKVAIKAYPTHEAGGFVWTFMGPQATMPGPPDYEFCRVPETHRYVSKNLERCNYLQALEGGLDSVHATILHKENNGDLAFLGNFEELVPRLDVERTAYGYYYTGIRTIGEREWVRVYQFLMPATQMRGTVEGPFLRKGHMPRMDGHIWIPIDDENTNVYNFMYSYDPATPMPLDHALELERLFGRAPEDVLPDFSLRQSAENDYMLDRRLQKTTNFSGITGVNTQDWAIQQGMGPVVDRSKEHLGTTDRAIIILRQLLLEASQAVERGEMPRGSDPASARNVRAADALIPKGADWKMAIPREVRARF